MTLIKRLLEEKDRRIAELEAELLSALSQAEHNGNELASLRQKIEDAPVVAWVIGGAECDMKGWIPTKAWSDGEFTTPLISKEDLK